MINFKDNLLKNDGQTAIHFIGQAGFIFKSKSGKLMVIDPYLSECVERVEGHIGFKRLLPKLFKPQDIIFDYIITTHFHKDHFDDDSIPLMMIENDTKLFAATDCLEDVNKFNIDISRVNFVKPGDTFIEDDYEFTFINCDHGQGAPKAVGAIVTVDGKNIVIVGDTCLRLDRVNEYLSKGPIDVLIAPINGKYGNLNSIECARLSGELNPRLTIPCHFGMFASHGGNPEEFINCMNDNYPMNKYLIMTMGEEYIF